MNYFSKKKKKKKKKKKDKIDKLTNIDAARALSAAKV